MITDYGLRITDYGLRITEKYLIKLDFPEDLQD
jgi:hypothetical protein